MPIVATAFEDDVPYDYWMKHACGFHDTAILNAAAQENDGSKRGTYVERMLDCPRCWAETNTEDLMMVPTSGRPFPEGASNANCLELKPDEAVPEKLWSRLAGEFEMVELWWATSGTPAC